LKNKWKSILDLLLPGNHAPKLQNDIQSDEADETPFHNEAGRKSDIDLEQVAVVKSRFT
jgi:hypothetical protein